MRFSIWVRAHESARICDARVTRAFRRAQPDPKVTGDSGCPIESACNDARFMELWSSGQILPAGISPEETNNKNGKNNRRGHWRDRQPKKQTPPPPGFFFFFQCQKAAGDGEPRHGGQQSSLASNAGARKCWRTAATPSIRRLRPHVCADGGRADDVGIRRRHGPYSGWADGSHRFIDGQSHGARV